MFARCGCYVRKQNNQRKEVFAVVLEDVGSALTYSRAEVKHIVETSNYGTSSSHRFLQGTHDSKKRRCLAFYVDNIPEKLRSKLLDGNCQLVFCMHDNYIGLTPFSHNKGVVQHSLEPR